jgi:transposase
VRERTAILNRIRGLLALHGITGIAPHTRKAWQAIQVARTPEDRGLPPATLAELRRCFARLQLLDEQVGEIEAERKRTQAEPPKDEAPATAALAVPVPTAMVAQLAAIKGLGLETAHTLVHELLRRPFRDRRAVARFVGLTGTPDESGTRRRDRGLARAGSPRLRQLLVQLAWRRLQFQPDAGLVQWYRRRVEQANGAGRKTFIVALARKLLIALWRYVRDRVVPQGFVLGTMR